MRRPSAPALPGFLLAAALFFPACGPPSVRSTAAPDPTVTCPGSWKSWSLEILDRRANREGSEKLLAALDDAIRKSFPGCEWAGPGVEGRPTVTIEIHRFAAPFVEGMWSGVADWSVWVRDPEGRTLTEFEASSDTERPNYYGSNNEKEALQAVFGEALDKTAAGLRSVPGGAPASSFGDTGDVKAAANSLKTKRRP
jgi:hypothetical protein